MKRKSDEKENFSLVSLPSECWMEIGKRLHDEPWRHLLEFSQLALVERRLAEAFRVHWRPDGSAFALFIAQLVPCYNHEKACRKRSRFLESVSLLRLATRCETSFRVFTSHTSTAPLISWVANFRHNKQPHSLTGITPGSLIPIKSVVKGMEKRWNKLSQCTRLRFIISFLWYAHESLHSHVGQYAIRRAVPSSRMDALYAYVKPENGDTAMLVADGVFLDGLRPLTSPLLNDIGGCTLYEIASGGHWGHQAQSNTFTQWLEAKRRLAPFVRRLVNSYETET
jgi:hypothetical protein